MAYYAFWNGPDLTASISFNLVLLHQFVLMIEQNLVYVSPSLRLASHHFGYLQKPAQIENVPILIQNHNRVNLVLGKHWLNAAERCPVYVWGLIGIEEGNASGAWDSSRFRALINQVLLQ